MKYPTAIEITNLILEATEKLLDPKLKNYINICLVESPYEIPSYVYEEDNCIIISSAPPIAKNINGFDVIIQPQYNFGRNIDTIEVFISNGDEPKSKYYYDSTVPSFMFLASELDNILNTCF